MHQKEVIHRDVKPGNLVILQWQPVFLVKTCDFGEAERKGVNDQNGYIGRPDDSCCPEDINFSACGPLMDI